MKKLATIEKITKFRKHPNADRLNLITVKGWQCVTAETYEVGDLVIYIQIDTTVPKAEWSKFLFKGDEERARIKSIKLRGKLSQGLCLPVDILNLRPDEGVMEGDDVTELLDVGKYEKPMPKNQDALGSFPTELVAKTDEERLQNSPELINEFKALDCDVYVSVKMDGTSGTFIKDLAGNLRACSRNQELKDGNNHYWNIARKYKLDEKLVPGSIFQGEICGPGIQKNHSGEKEVELYLFNSAFIGEGGYCGLDGLKQSSTNYSIPHVPIIYQGKFKWNSIEELLDYADTVKYDNGAQAEGIVIRPVVERFSETLQGRMSFKVISNKFAVKHGD